MSDKVARIPLAPVPMSQEACLLRRFGEGDEAAMTELVTAYQDQAFWIARHVVHNDEIALDVVQDAFVRVMRSWHSFEDSRSSFKAWFYQIIRNLAIDHLRKLRVRASQELVENADQRPAVDPVQRQETAERIRNIFASLSEAAQQLLIWRDVEGISPQDIAGMLGIEYATARWRIHQARKQFRSRWLATYGEELA